MEDNIMNKTMHDNVGRIWEYINENYVLSVLKAYQLQDLALLKQITEEFIEDCKDHFDKQRQEELTYIDD